MINLLSSPCPPQPKTEVRDVLINKFIHLIQDKLLTDQFEKDHLIPSLCFLIRSVECLSSSATQKRKTILLHAIERKDLTLLKLSLCFDPELIHTPGEDGMFPIILAALEGWEEGLDWLIDPSSLRISGLINLNCQTLEGQTALHKAQLYGHVACAKKLIQKGINKDIIDQWGLTAGDWVMYRLNALDENQIPLIKSPSKIIPYQVMTNAEFRPSRGFLKVSQIAKALRLV